MDSTDNRRRERSVHYQWSRTNRPIRRDNNSAIVIVYRREIFSSRARPPTCRATADYYYYYYDGYVEIYASAPIISYGPINDRDEGGVLKRKT